MKLALFLAACTVTAYTYGMEPTITMPDKNTLYRQLLKCYYCPEITASEPIICLARTTVTAALLNDAIHQSVHEYSTKGTFRAVVGGAYLLKQRSVSREEVVAMCIARKKTEVTDVLLHDFPEMRAAVQALQNTQS